MSRVALYITSLLICVALSGAAQSGSVSGGDNTIYATVEQMPRFRGGNIETFRKWLYDNITISMENVVVYGKIGVDVEFVVEKNGTLSNIKILKSSNEGLSREVNRVLKLSPAWTPGKKNGASARVKQSMFVDFKQIKPQTETKQTNKTAAPATGDLVQPTFMGGNVLKFNQWVDKNITFPAEALADGFSGVCKARYTIGKQGKITEVEILESPHVAISKAVDSLLKAAPAWTPATEKGDTVAVAIDISVNMNAKLSKAQLAKMTIRNTYPGIEEERFFGTPTQHASFNNACDILPKFEGGDIRAFRGWVVHNLTNNIRNLRTIYGTALFSFEVDTDGSVKDIKVVKSSNDELAQKVVEIISKSPTWTPGTLKGTPKSHQFRIPITFKGQGSVTLQPAQMVDSTNMEDTPYLVAEQMPRFEGGDLNSFRNWVQGNLVYPQDAARFKVQGRVIVDFVIERDGSLTNINVIKNPYSPLTKEVIRVLGESPKWTPGMIGGKPVRVRYTLPTDFKIKEDLFPQRPSPSDSPFTPRRR